MPKIVRRDEVYGPGGFLPEHPSRNVVDLFETDEDGWVTVKHFTPEGKAVEDRKLTRAEVVFFYGPLVGDLDGSLRDRVQRLLDEDAGDS